MSRHTVSSPTYHVVTYPLNMTVLTYTYAGLDSEMFRGYVAAECGFGFDVRGVGRRSVHPGLDRVRERRGDHHHDHVIWHDARVNRLCDFIGSDICHSICHIE